MEEFDEIGCRRLWVLINGLPPEAAVWRVDGQQWTTLHELVAIATERIDAWGMLNARLHTDRKHQKHLPDAPLHIPRPGSDNADRQQPAKAKEKKDRYQLQKERLALFS